MGIVRFASLHFVPLRFAGKKLFKLRYATFSSFFLLDYRSFFVSKSPFLSSRRAFKRSLFGRSLCFAPLTLRVRSVFPSFHYGAVSSHVLSRRSVVLKFLFFVYSARTLRDAPFYLKKQKPPSVFWERFSAFTEPDLIVRAPFG